MNFRIKSEKVLSNEWGKLQAVTYELMDRDGTAKEHRAEVYQKGDAIAVLLYNKERGTVMLTRQFRLATVYNDNPHGMLIEACAGHIEDGATPEETVRKELEEETGFIIGEATPVMKLFMSPGILNQMLHFYVAAYTPEDKKSTGGGLADEGEIIDLLELPYAEAMAMIVRGEIMDAKTVILLQHAGLQGLL
jgi:nudix-type nucleoside diphosphatase (YffH/AdpP family)